MPFGLSLCSYPPAPSVLSSRSGEVGRPKAPVQSPYHADGGAEAQRLSGAFAQVSGKASLKTQPSPPPAPGSSKIH